MESEFITVPHAAKFLGVSKKRIYVMIQERKLAALRCGPRQTRIVRSSLEQFIRKARQVHEETLGLGVEERQEIEREAFKA